MDISDHLMDGNVMDTTEMDPFVLDLASPVVQPKPRNLSNGTPRSPSLRQEFLPTPKEGMKHLPYSTSQTGLVYDVRMRFHVEVRPEVNQGVHPEDPRRIYAIYKELVDAGLVDDPKTISPAPYVLARIPTRYVTKREVCAVHTEDHYNWVISLETWDNDLLHDAGQQMDSIYLSRNTPVCARLSAGGAIEACRAILNGHVKNAIAVIRPPGHHAEHKEPMGFCIFNNVPIAVKACQEEFGDKCRRVLILDWDVHHGNGVQQAFYDDPNVLYISLHVHQGGKFYPAGPAGDHLHCGEGAGGGLNINIPWRTAGMTDADYILAFQKIVMPIAQDFNPDLVVVSAGFDAAEGDMLGKCHVSPAGYSQMTHMLMSLADGKVAVCLEGGYNLRSIAVSALAVTRTLMGEPPGRPVTTIPTPSAIDTIEEVLRQQAKWWPCLSQGDQSRQLKQQSSERVHDVVRMYQAHWLWENLGMSELFIAHSKASKSFAGQVLATQVKNHADARPLLVIFHDPPKLTGSTNPRTQAFELHNTWLTDSVKQYTTWAVDQGFSVMDINIPKHHTEAEDDYEHAEPADEGRRSDETEVLAKYLWDNYIELSEASHIFFMGVGQAYSNLIAFLKKNDRCRDRLTKIIGFISDSCVLPSYKASTDDFLDRWYRDASRIFVADNHYVWERHKNKQPSKKWGNLERSKYNDMQEMLASHQKEVTGILTISTEDWQQEVAPVVGANEEM
ncbi:histone deacetylase HdaA [Aureobasidium subglaciale]|nr:histone deacetylase HdaA [Aureobasidium subglaciale]KAI5222316.1 histone deacetylase HdaA [Aureobasidium subglaciale]KAI5226366.1 histone deacetylase HdaA [Aureobasidium subglaciale]KAI5258849.1 histone deacetylase HdaA [Aureobasidium subglaciale]KAI5262090.1 histone deacetylase HdaA [Aureobasidium subglaciale]